MPHYTNLEEEEEEENLHGISASTKTAVFDQISI